MLVGMLSTPEPRQKRGSVCFLASAARFLTVWRAEPRKRQVDGLHKPSSHTDRLAVLQYPYPRHSLCSAWNDRSRFSTNKDVPMKQIIASITVICLLASGFTMATAQPPKVGPDPK